MASQATWPPFDTAVRMQWAVLPFAERYYRELSSAVEALLDSHRMEWMSGVESGLRPGQRAAELVTAELRRQGGAAGLLVVTATHPSVSETSWEISGPRFYVSLVTCAQKEWPKKVPACPAQLADILWPCTDDRFAPPPPPSAQSASGGHDAHNKRGTKRKAMRGNWHAGKGPRVSELGWTCVPASSEPQQVRPPGPKQRQRVVRRTAAVVYADCLYEWPLAARRYRRRRVRAGSTTALSPAGERFVPHPAPQMWQPPINC